MRKYTNGYNLFVYFCMLVLLSSCTKGFDELNTDKTKIETLAPKQLDKLFSSAEYGGILNTDQWAGGYQLLVSLASDEQAQFFSCTQKAFTMCSPVPLRTSFAGTKHSKAFRCTERGGGMPTGCRWSLL